jgi:agmatine/peptidylarginine deiminase
MLTTLPAEWHPQRAVMLTWPRADGDFSNIFPEVEACFIAIASAIAAHTPLLITTAGDAAALESVLLRAEIPRQRFQILKAPTDDVWARDHGPITVSRDAQAVHLDFGFNGWGGKFPAENDNRITAALYAAGLLPGRLETVDFIIEGGAIESDGEGSLLTTSSCLLAPTRNGKTDRARVESRLKPLFGVERILWLDHGDLSGDDTDGHIDTLARFCNPQTIAFQACEDPNDEHFKPLSAMAEQLASMRQTDGHPYHLVPLPLPRAIHDDSGRRLPAGYANFLITNGAVLVPTYDDPADAVALERLRRSFPKHQVIGIDCRALIHQYGSLHCVTMQIPELN